MAVHVECVLGDVFGSLACECGRHLAAALELIVSAGHGMQVYLRAELLRHLTDPAANLLTAGQQGLAHALIADLGVWPLPT